MDPIVAKQVVECDACWAGICSRHWAIKPKDAALALVEWINGLQEHIKYLNSSPATEKDLEKMREFLRD